MPHNADKDLLYFFQSVWGSFWKDGKWGFKCCHSCIKESYCTGAAGKEASKTSLPALTNQDQPTEQAQTSGASPVKARIKIINRYPHAPTRRYSSRIPIARLPTVVRSKMNICGGPCMMRSNTSWVMVALDYPHTPLPFEQTG